MRITSRMLPPEVVREVRDQVKVQVTFDNQAMSSLTVNDQSLPYVDRIVTILKLGEEDRKEVNQAISESRILFGQCYRNCHHCCSMRRRYEVETFDILLSFWMNSEKVKLAYQTGKFSTDNHWCGMLEKGLCIINQYKPYICLLTSPSPRGAEKGGCRFRGDKNVKISVHKHTMVVAERMRLLFRKWLPELPEFAGKNMNQAFMWAIKTNRRFKNFYN